MDLFFPLDDQTRQEFKASAVQIGFEEVTAECTAHLHMLEPHDKLAVLVLAWSKIGDYLTQNQYDPCVGTAVNWVGRYTLHLWFGRDWIACSNENKTSLIEHMMKVYPAAYITMHPYSWPYMFSIYRDPWMIAYLNANFQRYNGSAAPYAGIEPKGVLEAKDIEFLQQEGIALAILRLVHMFDFNMIQLVKHICLRLLWLWDDQIASISIRATPNSPHYMDCTRHIYLIAVCESNGNNDLNNLFEYIQRSMQCNTAEPDTLQDAAHIIAKGLQESKTTLMEFLNAFLLQCPATHTTNLFGCAIVKYTTFVTEYLLKKLHSLSSKQLFLSRDSFYVRLVNIFIKHRESSEDLMQTTAALSEKLFSSVHNLECLKLAYEQVKSRTRSEWYTSKLTILIAIINEELNKLEVLKYTEDQVTDELIANEKHLATFYCELSKLLVKVPYLEQESWLTTFSLYPCKEYLECVTRCGTRNLRAIKKQASKFYVSINLKPKRPVKSIKEEPVTSVKEETATSAPDIVPETNTSTPCLVISKQEPITDSSTTADAYLQSEIDKPFETTTEPCTSASFLASLSNPTETKISELSTSAAFLASLVKEVKPELNVVNPIEIKGEILPKVTPKKRGPRPKPNNNNNKDESNAKLENVKANKSLIKGKRGRPNGKPNSKLVDRKQAKEEKALKSLIVKAIIAKPDDKDKDSAEVLFSAAAGASDVVSQQTEESIKYPSFALINSVTDTEDLIKFTDYDNEVVQYHELNRVLLNLRLKDSVYDDILALIVSPRYKRLTWAICWKILRKRCRELLTKEPKKRQLVQQCMADANDRLTHLHIDYDKYKDKPQIDYGTIEGGYECFETESGEDLKPVNVGLNTTKGSAKKSGVRGRRPKLVSDLFTEITRTKLSSPIFLTKPLYICYRGDSKSPRLSLSVCPISASSPIVPPQRSPIRLVSSDNNLTSPPSVSNTTPRLHPQQRTLLEILTGHAAPMNSQTPVDPATSNPQQRRANVSQQLLNLLSSGCIQIQPNLSNIPSIPVSAGAMQRPVSYSSGEDQETPNFMPIAKMQPSTSTSILQQQLSKPYMRPSTSRQAYLDSADDQPKDLTMDKSALKAPQANPTDLTTNQHPLVLPYAMSTDVSEPTQPDAVNLSCQSVDQQVYVDPSIDKIVNNDSQVMEETLLSELIPSTSSNTIQLRQEYGITSSLLNSIYPPISWHETPDEKKVIDCRNQDPRVILSLVEAAIANTSTPISVSFTRFNMLLAKWKQMWAIEQSALSTRPPSEGHNKPIIIEDVMLSKDNEYTISATHMDIISPTASSKVQKPKQQRKRQASADVKIAKRAKAQKSRKRPAENVVTISPQPSKVIARARKPRKPATTKRIEPCDAAAVTVEAIIDEIRQKSAKFSNKTVSTTEPTEVQAPTVALEVHSSDAIPTTSAAAVSGEFPEPESENATATSANVDAFDAPEGCALETQAIDSTSVNAAAPEAAEPIQTNSEVADTVEPMQPTSQIGSVPAGTANVSAFEAATSTGNASGDFISAVEASAVVLTEISTCDEPSVPIDASVKSTEFNAGIDSAIVPSVTCNADAVTAPAVAHTIQSDPISVEASVETTETTETDVPTAPNLEVSNFVESSETVLPIALSANTFEVPSTDAIPTEANGSSSSASAPASELAIETPTAPDTAIGESPEPATYNPTTDDITAAASTPAIELAIEKPTTPDPSIIESPEPATCNPTPDDITAAASAPAIELAIEKPTTPDTAIVESPEPATYNPTTDDITAAASSPASELGIETPTTPDPSTIESTEPATSNPTIDDIPALDSFGITTDMVSAVDLAAITLVASGLVESLESTSGINISNISAGNASSVLTDCVDVLEVKDSQTATAEGAVPINPTSPVATPAELFDIDQLAGEEAFDEKSVSTSEATSSVATPGEQFDIDPLAGEEAIDEKSMPTSEATSSVAAISELFDIDPLAVEEAVDDQSVSTSGGTFAEADIPHVIASSEEDTSEANSSLDTTSGQKPAKMQTEPCVILAAHTTSPETLAAYLSSSTDDILHDQGKVFNNNLLHPQLKTYVSNRGSLKVERQITSNSNVAKVSDITIATTIACTIGHTSTTSSTITKPATTTNTSSSTANIDRCTGATPSQLIMPFPFDVVTSLLFKHANANDSSLRPKESSKAAAIPPPNHENVKSIMDSLTCKLKQQFIKQQHEFLNMNLDSPDDDIAVILFGRLLLDGDEQTISSFPNKDVCLDLEISAPKLSPSNIQTELSINLGEPEHRGHIVKLTMSGKNKSNVELSALLNEFARSRLRAGSPTIYSPAMSLKEVKSGNMRSSHWLKESGNDNFKWMLSTERKPLEVPSIPLSAPNTEMNIKHKSPGVDTDATDVTAATKTATPARSNKCSNIEERPDIGAVSSFAQELGDLFSDLSDEVNEIENFWQQDAANKNTTDEEEDTAETQRRLAANKDLMACADHAKDIENKQLMACTDFASEEIQAVVTADKEMVRCTRSASEEIQALVTADKEMVMCTLSAAEETRTVVTADKEMVTCTRSAAEETQTVVTADKEMVTCTRSDVGETQAVLTANNKMVACTGSASEEANDNVNNEMVACTHAASEEKQIMSCTDSAPEATQTGYEQMETPKAFNVNQSTGSRIALAIFSIARDMKNIDTDDENYRKKKTLKQIDTEQDIPQQCSVKQAEVTCLEENSRKNEVSKPNRTQPNEEEVSFKESLEDSVVKLKVVICSDAKEENSLQREAANENSAVQEENQGSDQPDKNQNSDNTENLEEDPTKTFRKEIIHETNLEEEHHNSVEENSCQPCKANSSDEDLPSTSYAAAVKRANRKMSIRKSAPVRRASTRNVEKKIRQKKVREDDYYECAIQSTANDSDDDDGSDYLPRRRRPRVVRPMKLRCIRRSYVAELATESSSCSSTAPARRNKRDFASKSTSKSQLTSRSSIKKTNVASIPRLTASEMAAFKYYKCKELQVSIPSITVKDADIWCRKSRVILIRYPIEEEDLPCQEEVDVPIDFECPVDMEVDADDECGPDEDPLNVNDPPEEDQMPDNALKSQLRLRLPLPLPVPASESSDESEEEEEDEQDNIALDPPKTSSSDSSDDDDDDSLGTSRAPIGYRLQWGRNRNAGSVSARESAYDNAADENRVSSTTEDADYAPNDKSDENNNSKKELVTSELIGTPNHSIEISNESITSIPLERVIVAPLTDMIKIPIRNLEVAFPVAIGVTSSAEPNIRTVMRNSEYFYANAPTTFNNATSTLRTLNSFRYAADNHVRNEAEDSDGNNERVRNAGANNVNAAGAINVGTSTAGTSDAGRSYAGASNAGTSTAGTTTTGTSRAEINNAGTSNAGASTAGTNNAGTSNAKASIAGTKNAGTSNVGASSAGTNNAAGTSNAGTGIARTSTAGTDNAAGASTAETDAAGILLSSSSVNYDLTTTAENTVKTNKDTTAAGDINDPKTSHSTKDLNNEAEYMLDATGAINTTVAITITGAVNITGANYIDAASEGILSPNTQGNDEYENADLISHFVSSVFDNNTAAANFYGHNHSIMDCDNEFDRTSDDKSCASNRTIAAVNTNVGNTTDASRSTTLYGTAVVGSTTNASTNTTAVGSTTEASTNTTAVENTTNASTNTTAIAITTDVSTNTTAVASTTDAFTNTTAVASITDATTNTTAADSDDYAAARDANTAVGNITDASSSATFYATAAVGSTTDASTNATAVESENIEVARNANTAVGNTTDAASNSIVSYKGTNDSYNNAAARAAANFAFIEGTKHTAASNANVASSCIASLNSQQSGEYESVDLTVDADTYSLDSTNTCDIDVPCCDIIDLANETEYKPDDKSSTPNETSATENIRPPSCEIVEPDAYSGVNNETKATENIRPPSCEIVEPDGYSGANSETKATENIRPPSCEIVEPDGHSGANSETKATENIRPPSCEIVEPDGYSGANNEMSATENIRPPSCEIVEPDGYSGANNETNATENIRPPSCEIVEPDGYSGANNETNATENIRPPSCEIVEPDGYSGSNNETNATENIRPPSCEIVEPDGYSGANNVTKANENIRPPSCEIVEPDGYSGANNETNATENIRPPSCEIVEPDGYSGANNETNATENIRPPSCEIVEPDGYSGSNNETNATENIRPPSCEIVEPDGYSGANNVTKANENIRPPSCEIVEPDGYSGANNETSATESIRPPSCEIVEPDFNAVANRGNRNHVRKGKQTGHSIVVSSSTEREGKDKKVDSTNNYDDTFDIHNINQGVVDLDDSSVEWMPYESVALILSGAKKTDVAKNTSASNNSTIDDDEIVTVDSDIEDRDPPIGIADMDPIDFARDIVAHLHACANATVALDTRRISNAASEYFEEAEYLFSSDEDGGASSDHDEKEKDSHRETAVTCTANDDTNEENCEETEEAANDDTDGENCEETEGEISSKKDSGANADHDEKEKDSHQETAVTCAANDDTDGENCEETEGEYSSDEDSGANADHDEKEKDSHQETAVTCAANYDTYEENWEETEGEYCSDENSGANADHDENEKDSHRETTVTCAANDDTDGENFEETERKYSSDEDSGANADHDEKEKGSHRKTVVTCAANDDTDGENCEETEGEYSSGEDSGANADHDEKEKDSHQETAVTFAANDDTDGENCEETEGEYSSDEDSGANADHDEKEKDSHRETTVTCAANDDTDGENCEESEGESISDSPVCSDFNRYTHKVTDDDSESYSNENELTTGGCKRAIEYENSENTDERKSTNVVEKADSNVSMNIDSSPHSNIDRNINQDLPSSSNYVENINEAPGGSDVEKSDTVRRTCPFVDEDSPISKKSRKDSVAGNIDQAMPNTSNSVGNRNTVDDAPHFSAVRNTNNPVVINGVPYNRSSTANIANDPHSNVARNADQAMSSSSNCAANRNTTNEALNEDDSSNKSNTQNAPHSNVARNADQAMSSSSNCAANRNTTNEALNEDDSSNKSNTQNAPHSNVAGNIDQAMSSSSNCAANRNPTNEALNEDDSSNKSNNQNAPHSNVAGNIDQAMSSSSNCAANRNPTNEALNEDDSSNKSNNQNAPHSNVAGNIDQAMSSSSNCAANRNTTNEALNEDDSSNKSNDQNAPHSNVAENIGQGSPTSSTNVANTNNTYESPRRCDVEQISDAVRRMFPFIDEDSPLSKRSRNDIDSAPLGNVAGNIDHDLPSTSNYTENRNNTDNAPRDNIDQATASTSYCVRNRDNIDSAPHGNVARNVDQAMYNTSSSVGNRNTVDDAPHCSNVINTNDSSLDDHDQRPVVINGVEYTRMRNRENMENNMSGTSSSSRSSYQQQHSQNSNYERGRDGNPRRGSRFTTIDGGTDYIYEMFQPDIDNLDPPAILTLGDRVCAHYISPCPQNTNETDDLHSGHHQMFRTPSPQQSVPTQGQQQTQQNSGQQHMIPIVSPPERVSYPNVQLMNPNPSRQDVLPTAGQQQRILHPNLGQMLQNTSTQSYLEHQPIVSNAERQQMISNSRQQQLLAYASPQQTFTCPQQMFTSPQQTSTSSSQTSMAPSSSQQEMNSYFGQQQMRMMSTVPTPDLYLGLHESQLDTNLGQQLISPYAVPQPIISAQLLSDSHQPQLVSNLVPHSCRQQIVPTAPQQVRYSNEPLQMAEYLGEPPPHILSKLNQTQTFSVTCPQNMTPYASQQQTESAPVTGNGSNYFEGSTHYNDPNRRVSPPPVIQVSPPRKPRDKSLPLSYVLAFIRQDMIPVFDEYFNNANDSREPSGRLQAMRASVTLSSNEMQQAFLEHMHQKIATVAAYRNLRSTNRRQRTNLNLEESPQIRPMEVLPPDFANEWNQHLEDMILIDETAPREGKSSGDHPYALRFPDLDPNWSPF